MTRSATSRAAYGRLSGFAVLMMFMLACGHKAGVTTSCVQPPAGIGPDATATLQNADEGKTVCLKVGDVLSVFLKADHGARWGPVSFAGRPILARRNNGALTLPIGVTAAIFQVKATGVVQLTSARPPCVPSTACKSNPVWSATVVVR